MRRFLLTVIFSIFIPLMFNSLYAMSLNRIADILKNIEIEKGHLMTNDQPLYTFSGSNSILDQTVEFEFLHDGSPQRILVGTALIVCSFIILFFGLIKDRKVS